jgi:hypothetical protein
LHPHLIQKPLEAVLAVDQHVEVDPRGEVTTDPPGYLHLRARRPQGVFEGEAVGPARRP